MRRAAIALLFALVGCGTLKIPPSPGFPHGAELSAIGEASARATIGPKMTTTFDNAGNPIEQVCEEATGQQCIAYEVKGGAFTGWTMVLSVVSFAFQIFESAR